MNNYVVKIYSHTGNQELLHETPDFLYIPHDILSFFCMIFKL